MGLKCSSTTSSIIKVWQWPYLAMLKLRHWSELPLDALASILGKLGAIEILMGAGLVCRTWLAAAKLPDLWRSVGMARHKVVVELEKALSWSMEPGISGDVLCAMARVAVDRSDGRMEQFAGKLFVTDELLKYIGDRSPALKAVSLTSCDGVSNEGFAHLVSKCPQLVVIQLSHCKHVGGRDVYESAGMACAQLKRFDLHKAPSFFFGTRESSGEALGIGAMHQLRRLTLLNSDVTNDELVAILDGCPHLVHLDLSFCENIVDDDALRARCAGIKSLMLPIQEEEKLSSPVTLMEIITVQCASALKRVLDSFAEFSGLHINYSKSTLVPIHMSQDDAVSCVQALGCKQETFPQPYLGLPLSINKLPVSAFTPYVHKSDRYLSSWQATMLNTMGRTVLVNSVLDSQLVYFMSSLQVPPSVVDQCNKRRRAFLWTGEKNGKAKPSSCLVAWANVCKPKEHGGLGVKDMSIQNICLLLKLLHRLHHPSTSAWAQWVRNRVDVASLQGDIAGPHWTVLKEILPLYQAVTTVTVGDGKTTSFWSDVWLGDEAFADCFPSLFSHSTAKHASVATVIQSGVHASLAPRLSVTAQNQLQQLQQRLAQINLSTEPDNRSSFFSKGDGVLDSAPIYKLLVSKGQPETPLAKFIWENHAPPRIQLFMWLLTQERIQSRSVLLKKHIVDTAICEVCSQAAETASHIISECPLATQFWSRLNIPQMLITPPESLYNVSPPADLPKEEFSGFIALGCWHLWKARNSQVFRNDPWDINTLLLHCRADAELWKLRMPRKKRMISDKWCHLLDMARAV